MKRTLDKSVHLLTAILAVIVLLVILLTLYQLYNAAFRQAQDSLVETVKSQARLIEAVARFDLKYSQHEMPGGAEEATMSQIREAHQHYRGMGKTGEFVLAKLEKGKIKFLLHNRYSEQLGGQSISDDIQVGDPLAIPMQLALSGKAGTTVAKDYRGTLVLAAYEPVSVLDYGIVAKIDLDEVKTPFIKAGVASLLFGLLLIGFGLWGFRSVSLPLIKRVYESEEKYRLAMDAAQEGLWDWDVGTGEVYYSPGWMSIIGEARTDADYSFWEERLHPEDKEHTLLSLRLHLAGRTPDWQEEHRLRRSDGSWVWVLGRGQVVKRDADGNPLRMIGTLIDIESQKANEEIIWQQANYDQLTHLPNRKLFHEILDQNIRKAQRSGQLLWVLFLDLDGFKEINDSLGHTAGDKLLVMVADRLQLTLRESDFVARLGGDEFVIILSDVADVADVDRISSKLVDVVRQNYQLEDRNIYVTISIGIANYPNDASNANELLMFADQSMYAAKAGGKNRYSYFTPALQKASLLRMQMAADLRQAVANREFELFFQPIIDLSNGSVHKAEALIRWHHPEKGLITPEAFIPVAEETGFICDIGALVFEMAFGQLQKWQRYLDRSFQLSINMSPFQLKMHDTKYDNWLEMMKNHGIAGESLVVEITEGLLLKSEAIVTDRLLQYRDAGIQVAIDDFGTGYSSLAYLKEFHIDFLKIDRSFIHNLRSGSSEESLCEAIVVMAHKLGLQVIAEGIETERQLQLLKSMDCDFGQGYYFSVPESAEAFETTYLSPAVVQIEI